MARNNEKKNDPGTGDAENAGRRDIVIKKYANRRLYNTATSSYIVLNDIVDLIKTDVPFRIEDAKSGEDITRSILNQVIFEQESEGTAYHFPLEFQKKLISMYGDNYGSLIPDYLTQSIELFVSERNKMSEAFESMLGRNAQTMLEFSQALAKQNLEMFKNSWNIFGAMSGTASEPQATGSAIDEPGDQSTELDEIQAKMDALQERLKNLK